MIAQRTIPAFRQLAQRRAVPFVGRRMESTAADKPKAKLVRTSKMTCVRRELGA